MNIKLDKLSLIISFLAFGVSIYFGITSNQFIKKQIELEEESTKSKLVVQIEIDYNQDTVVFEKINSLFYKVYYKQKYNLIVNNLGQVDASVTGFYVDVETKMYNSNKIGYSPPPGMKTSYYDSRGKEISLPFSIEPNKPKKIIMEVGVKVPIQAWEKISDNLVFGKVYDYQEVEKLFLKNGNPAMGQMESIEDNTYGDKGNIQKYHLYIIKGDGNTVNALFFYNVSNHLQGETN